MNTRRWRHLGALAATAVVALLGALLVGSPASAAPTKYYTATAAPIYAGGNPTVYTPAVVTLTNVTASQTLGSAEIDFPTAGLTWSFNPSDPGSCVVTRANGNASSCAANAWTVTTPTVTNPFAVRVETASNTKSALGNGDSVTVTVQLTGGSLTGETPVPTVAKQSNTFNDNKSGNLFTLQGAPLALSVTQIDPSEGQICAPSQNPCTLTSTDGQLDTASTSTSDPSTVLMQFGDPGQCGSFARPSVEVNVFSASAKTIDLTWTKDFTLQETNNGASLWPVCMIAPYAFWSVGSNGRLVQVANNSTPAQLPSCSVLAAAGKTGPCVSQLKKVGAGQQFAEILVPGNSQDPKFF